MATCKDENCPVMAEVAEANGEARELRTCLQVAEDDANDLRVRLKASNAIAKSRYEGIQAAQREVERLTAAFKHLRDRKPREGESSVEFAEWCVLFANATLKFEPSALAPAVGPCKVCGKAHPHVHSEGEIPGYVDVKQLPGVSVVMTGEQFAAFIGSKPAPQPEAAGETGVGVVTPNAGWARGRLPDPAPCPLIPNEPVPAPEGPQVDRTCKTCDLAPCVCGL